MRNAARSSKLPAAMRVHVGEASRVEAVVRVSRDHDLVISATRPPAGSEGELVRTTKALLSGLGQTGIRLLLVGGTASLTVPGDEKRAALEPGERTGAYRLGSDELVVDPNGVSRISVKDFAVALMDEAERPVTPGPGSRSLTEASPCEATRTAQ